MIKFIDEFGHFLSGGSFFEIKVWSIEAGQCFQTLNSVHSNLIKSIIKIESFILVDYIIESVILFNQKIEQFFWCKILKKSVFIKIIDYHP